MEIITTTHINTTDLLIKKIIDEAWLADNFPLHLGRLADGVQELAVQVVEVGELAYQSLQEEGNNELDAYLVNFQWAGKAKELLLLVRDVFFEEQKSFILIQDGKISPGRLEEQKAAAKEALTQAANNFGHFFDEAKKEIQQSGKLDKQLYRWASQTNPWPIYKEQLLDIIKHVQRIRKEHLEMLDITANFQKIAALIQQTVASCIDEIIDLVKLAESTIINIQESEDDKIGRIAQYIEEKERNMEMPNVLNEFTTLLDHHLGELPQKQTVPVNTLDGVIQFKEIFFRKSTRLWLESEILPIIYEIWELIEQVRNGLKMALVNIQNRAILLGNEIKEGKTVDLKEKKIELPLISFIKNTSLWEEEMEGLRNITQKRLDDNFRINSVYSKQVNFLPLPLQSTINQFKINQSNWLSGIRNWLNRQASALHRFQSLVRQEDNLSTAEKVVRYIHSHTDTGQNSQYANIFLTMGYIGESFWVGRENELQHIRNIINQWKNGYRGAAIVSGQRFSGKSLFVELVANRYFNKSIIKLSPATSLIIEGRRFTTSHNLGDALEFIQKYASPDNRPAVLIDDLELWSDHSVSLSQNVRQLSNYIDLYSRKIFFLVSMGNAIKTHLNKTHAINKVFQAEINLDHMSKAEISQAILIRHGATHKTLVDGEGVQIQPQQFKKMAERIYRVSHGNIGEALNRWSLLTNKVDDERVIHQFRLEYGLPDFLQPDTALLLAAITMEKRTTEYNLRKLFGPPFKTKYRSILQRLISVGLVKRHMDSWLEINEVAANAVGRLLEKRQYLTFKHQ